MVEIFQLQLHKSSAVPLYQQLAEGHRGDDYGWCSACQ